MTKNKSIMLIAVLAAVIVAGMVAVTVTTGQVFAFAGNGGDGGDGSIGINQHVHNPCGNAGALAHNPHCQI